MKLQAERLYVRCPNWVGDFVMATPILRAIRESFPGAHVTLGLRPHLEPILRGASWFDATHAHPGGLGLRGLRALARDLAQRRFDAAILFPNSFETALLAYLARIPRRFGYAANGRSLLLTDRLRPPTARGRRVPTPMPHYWTDLVGLAGVEVRSIRPELTVDGSTVTDFARWLDARGIGASDRMVLVAPGASFGASKLWRTDRFAEVVDGLAARAGTKALVQCGPGEEAIAREIVERCRSHAVLAEDPALDLHRLKAAARRCDLLLCTDSGVRHYGVAFDRPVVCVMGPNDPRYTAANLDRTIVVREDVDCGPCQLKVCPLDHRCMEGLESRRVLDACLRLLERPRAAVDHASTRVGAG